MSEVRVLRQLPYLLRKAAEPGTAMRALTFGLGRAVDALVDDATAVTAARTLGGVAHRAEARRIAALLRLAPWDDEDLRAFRIRIRTMAGIYRQGVADATRLLRMLAMCSDATIGPVLLPVPDHATGHGLRTDRWTTAAWLTQVAPDDGVAARFHAVVEDWPLCEETFHHEPEVPAGVFAWTVSTALVGSPALSTAAGEIAATGLMPSFTISAGAEPLVAPLIVQRDLRRVILLNRVVPAGSSVTFDGSTLRVEGGDAGPVRFDDDAPDVLAGVAGSWASGGAAPSVWDDPSARTDDRAVFGDRWLRLYAIAALALAEDDPVGAEAHLPLAAILPWPWLMGAGDSHWALLAADLAPDAPATPWQHLSFAPAAPVAGRAVDMRWQGRRPASFTVRFPPERCSRSGAQADPVRRAWFDEQVRRLKLAGVRYIRQEDTWRPAESLAASLEPAAGGTSVDDGATDDVPPTPPAGDDASTLPAEDDDTPIVVEPEDDAADVDAEAEVADPDAGITDGGVVPTPAPPPVDDTPAPPAVPGGVVHRTTMGACLVQGLEPLAVDDRLAWTVTRRTDGG